MARAANAILLEIYRRERGQPFAWGSADCITFCAACALALTGRDPIAHWRGRYDSDAGLKRAMVEEGFRSIADAAASLYPEIPMASAKSGDWAFVVNDDGRESLGVVCRDMVMAKSIEGIGLVPLHRASRMFQVT